MAKIIILNAPPGAGKDTIANLIVENSWNHVAKISFKQPMFEIALAIMGKENYGYFIEHYEDREWKEKALSILNGKTPREFMIWISETVIKPEFGKRYFGERLAESANDSRFPIIVSDGGFTDEVIELIDNCHEVKLCRLHRNGYTFEGDSRNYIKLPKKYHGANGYSEHDYMLVDGDPMVTVRHIIDDHLNK